VKARLAVLLAVAATGFAGVAVAPTSSGVPVVASAEAKTCSAGWVHASLSWGHKCLGRGQFCKSYQDREYHRYRFHCHGGRLT